MGLRDPRQGEYYGHALWTIEGLWRVSVSRSDGWNAGDGWQWTSVPPENFFRTDVLTRQLAAAGFRMEPAVIQDGTCRLKPVGNRIRYGHQAGPLKRFLGNNYGQFQGKPVHWSWSIRQYD
jgi:hypothetical protein